MTKYACLLLVGCGALQFDVSQELPEQTIQGSLLGGILPSFVPNPISLDFDVKAETQRRNTGPATKVQLKSLKLQLTAPGDGNFDFLDEVHIFISAPGLPRIEICDALNIQDGLGELTFRVVPELDLLPYVNAGADLTATASGTQPRVETTFSGNVTITVFI